jgi:hypothetical protein
MIERIYYWHYGNMLIYNMEKLTILYNLLTYSVFNFTHFFIENTLEDTVLDFINNEANALISKENEHLLAAFKRTIEKPEFKREWRLFLNNVDTLIREFMETFNNAIDKDKDLFYKNIHDILHNMSRQAITGLSTGVQTAIGDVPPLGLILSGLNSITVALKMISQTLNLLDSTISPLAAIIPNDEVLSTFDSITNLLSLFEV